MKRLIVNADDFGYGFLFNKMILELINERKVTSTSVMVDRISSEQNEQIKELIELSKKGFVSVGLHVEFKNTNFNDEIKRQFEKFIQIFSFKPSHLDIHKMEYIEKGYPSIREFCKKEDIQCKNVCTPYKLKEIDGLRTNEGLCFDGTNKTISEIEKWLSSLGEGTYTIAFHPGYYDPNSKSSFNKVRETDAVNIREMYPLLSKYGIQLTSFNTI